MSYNIRRIVVALFIVFFLIAGYFLIRSTWPLEHYLLFQIRRSAPQVQVSKLMIGSARFMADDYFIMKDVFLEGQWEGKTGQLAVQEVALRDWRELLQNPQKANALLKGIHLISSEASFTNAWAKVNFFKKGDTDWAVNGHLAIPYMRLLKQGVESVSANFLATPQSLKLFDMNASLMKGNVRGQFVLDYAENLPYSMDIFLSGLNTASLPPEAAGLNKQIRGMVEGSLKLSGNDKRIIHLDAKINAPQGAQVNPLLLKFLTNYIPQSEQKKRLETIIAKGEYVFLDRFVLDVKNDNNNQLKTAFDMKSVDFNLDIKLGVDINVDSGLMSLFQSSLQFIPKEFK
ncbi:MAG TPA: hypothetical protein VI749_02685 [Candidatus Omnitrophota bacterium]|nr:hypothetical protein [Candidatus Omnitrophota bacterium]